MRLFYFVLVTLFFLFTFPVTVFAATLFNSSHAVSYVVSQTGLTTVTHVITLTNKVSHVYAKSYSLTVGISDITNIQVKSAEAILPVQLVTHDETSDIYIDFPEVVTGFGNEQQFTLTYQTNQIARKFGRIWEVVIPGIIKADDITAYTVSLTTPPSFGPAAYSKPASRNGIWTLADLQKGGIMLAFGDYQHARFALQYTLTNPEATKKLMSIVFPPTTDQQFVSLDRINPAPVTVVSDRDGNWLAQYELAPLESFDIEVQGEVAVFLDRLPGHQEGFVIDPELEQQLLAPVHFWEAPESFIVQNKGRLTTPRDIYDLVVATLSYNYNRQPQQITRKGATGSLQNPTDALCLEFSDLFIALARASHIKARMVQGYAYTTNPKLQSLSLQTDVLHAWVQYYDEGSKRFISIDPTWGNTTGGSDYFSRFDFNHIAFALLGVDSSTPAPAGSYRKLNRTKDIEISFLDTPYVIRSPEIAVSFGQPYTSNETTTTTATVRNVSKVLYTTRELSATSTSGSVSTQLPGQITIPPLGFVEIPLIVQNPSGNPLITLKLDDQIFTSSPTTSQDSPYTVWGVRFFIAGLILFGIFAWVYNVRHTSTY